MKARPFNGTEIERRPLTTNGAAPPLDYSRLLQAALAASTAASEVLTGRFRPKQGSDLRTWMKSPGALVTDADLESDRVIAETLRGSGVPGEILSEEGGAASEQATLRQAQGGPEEAPHDTQTQDATLSLSKGGGDNNRLTWLIDPLCGTVPFSTGMSHWGINICLRNGDMLEVAALTLPAMRDRLAAVRGRGVSLNGMQFRPTPPAGRLAEVAVGMEINGHERARLLNAGTDGALRWVTKPAELNMFSSCAYPMAQICMARLSAGVFYGIEPVHMADGAMVAQELGLPVTDDSGEPIDWSGDEAIPVVVVGWPEVHAQLIDAMRS